MRSLWETCFLKYFGNRIQKSTTIKLELHTPVIEYQLSSRLKHVLQSNQEQFFQKCFLVAQLMGGVNPISHILVQHLHLYNIPKVPA